MMRLICILPALLLATAVQSAQLGFKLTWDANDPLESVTNYAIYIRDASTNDWQTNYNCGTNTRCAVYFNDAGTGSLPYPTFAAPWSSTDRPARIVVAATARNAVGESDFSESVTITNTPLPTKGIQIEILSTGGNNTIGFDPIPDMARIDSSTDLVSWDEAYTIITADPMLRPRYLGWQVYYEGRPAGFWRIVNIGQ